MADPTQPVLIAAFSVAITLFIVTSVIRKIVNRKDQASNQPLTTAPPEVPPVAGPVAPPPLPLSPPLSNGVPTWPYRRWDFIWMALICIIFGGLSLASLSPEEKKSILTPGALVGSIIFHFSLSIITIVVVSFRISLITWLGLRWKHWPWVFLIAPSVVISMWVLFSILQFSGYMEWMESLGVNVLQDSVQLLKTSTDPTVLILMAVAAVLVAPISEEIIFRGYLYAAAKKYAGTWVAAICTGLIFAAVHGSLAALLPLFIFGVILALLYEKTGSLWAPIAVHFCFNGATVAVQLIARQFPHLLDQVK